MKIIFLDFDGVLNSRSSLYLRTLEWPRNTSVAAPDPVCVRLMAKLLEITEAKVVVSSSWRNGMTLQQLRRCLWFEFGFNQCSVTNYVKYFPVIDKTRPPDADECRGDQIKDWLDAHPEVTEYVIVDDDSDMLEEQLGHFVRCENEHGFRGKQFDACIRMLKVPVERIKQFEIGYLTTLVQS